MVVLLNTGLGLGDNLQGIASLASLASVMVIFCFSWKNQRQYLKDQEPQLTMRLDKRDCQLYFIVQNGGRIAAQNLTLTIVDIEKSGNYVLYKDKLWDGYDLYPEEIIFEEIGVLQLGANSESSPIITIETSYQFRDIKKKHRISRKVKFSEFYDTGVWMKLDSRLASIVERLSPMTRADVRMANYFDGYQVAPFNELNILANQSLQNDLYTTLGSENKRKILSRERTIEENMNNGPGGNKQAILTEEVQHDE